MTRHLYQAEEQSNTVVRLFSMTDEIGIHLKLNIIENQSETAMSK